MFSATTKTLAPKKSGWYQLKWRRRAAKLSAVQKNAEDNTAKLVFATSNMTTNKTNTTTDSSTTKKAKESSSAPTTADAPSPFWSDISTVKVETKKKELPSISFEQTEAAAAGMEPVDPDFIAGIMAESNTPAFPEDYIPQKERSHISENMLMRKFFKPKNVDEIAATLKDLDGAQTSHQEVTTLNLEAATEVVAEEGAVSPAVEGSSALTETAEEVTITAAGSEQEPTTEESNQLEAVNKVVLEESAAPAATEAHEAMTAEAAPTSVEAVEEVSFKAEEQQLEAVAEAVVEESAVPELMLHPTSTPVANEAAPALIEAVEEVSLTAQDIQVEEVITQDSTTQLEAVAEAVVEESAAPAATEAHEAITAEAAPTSVEAVEEVSFKAEEQQLEAVAEAVVEESVAPELMLHPTSTPVAEAAPAASEVCEIDQVATAEAAPTPVEEVAPAMLAVDTLVNDEEAVSFAKVAHHPTSSTPMMLLPLMHPTGNPYKRYTREVTAAPSTLEEESSSQPEPPVAVTLLGEEEARSMDMVSDEEHAQNIAAAKALAAQLVSLGKSVPTPDMVSANLTFAMKPLQQESREATPPAAATTVTSSSHPFVGKKHVVIDLNKLNMSTLHPTSGTSQ